MSFRLAALLVYCVQQRVSIETAASVLWLTMPTDKRLLGATAVAARFYVFSAVEGVITTHVYSMILQ